MLHWRFALGFAIGLGIGIVAALLANPKIRGPTKKSEWQRKLLKQQNTTDAQPDSLVEGN